MVYRGFGILAALIPVICILTGIYFGGTNGNGSYELFLYSLLASAPIVFIVGFLLNKRPPRQIQDPMTGSPVLVKKRHDFWFIKMEYWGIIWAVLAIVLLIVHKN